MNVLECFSGTHSVGKVCDQLGWNTISVDLELPATHKCDIMDFDYKQYPQDYFSIVWCSPPCVHYSRLQDSWLNRKKGDGIVYTKEIRNKNMDEADKLVLKSLEIINYFKPSLWCLENPQTGRLKDREIMKGLPYYDTDYCMYSDWGYRKRTRIWTNKKDWTGLLCDGSGDCGNMEENHHKKKVSDVHSESHCHPEGGTKKHKIHKINLGGSDHELRKKHFKDVSSNGGGTDRLDRYRVPETLILSLFID
jgi:site-specific DNA-cytosine methylase